MVHTYDCRRVGTAERGTSQRKREPPSLEARRFRVSGFGVRDSGFEIRVPGSGFRVPDFGFRVLGSGFRVPFSGFRVSGFEF